MTARVALGVALLISLGCWAPLSMNVTLSAAVGAEPVALSPLDELLAAENVGVKAQPAPLVNDLAFLRRITVDMIGRIPTSAEIEEYLAWSPSERRTQVIDKLLADGRFADRWTVFYSDLLRLRTNAEGGQAFLAFVHKAVEANMPYDEMVRQLLIANGKANYTPEVGFILGDGADPMAMAGVTSQTFMGIRIACAQCHDHPFDVWTREDFYGLAAYFGKTRRYENDFTNTIYTTETDATTVLWPPEGVGKPADRKPMVPKFPFKLAEGSEEPEYIVRLKALRAAQEQRKLAANDAKQNKVDDLLAEADKALEKITEAKPVDATGVLAENQSEVEKLKLAQGRYRNSELRSELAKLVTDPRNRYFAKNHVNRVWAELLGRGFVDPVDDFSQNNKPSHPKTLDYLADEFVAGGYDLKNLVRIIVTSQAYQREHLINVDEATRTTIETAFLATSPRRMISEALYDSIVVGGRLFDVKHENGKNLTTAWRHQQVVKDKKSEDIATSNLASAVKMTKPAMDAKTQPEAVPTSNAYSVEDAFELDFNAVLAKKDDAPEVEQMKMMSKEEIEAQAMSRQIGRPGVEYIDKYVKVIFDDNPRFSTALRMETPAPPTHFLRVFGQSTREALGEFRDHSPTMRQALLIMNGRLIHEASRVGELEPAYPLLAGKKKDYAQAVKLAYRDLLTREATEQEVKEGIELIEAGETPLAGYADFRWVLLNCNEFRFIP